jgi:nicotinamidase-related amidase
MQGMLTIDRKKTALVVIDLVKGIVSLPGTPHPTAEVVANAVKLADAFRKHRMPVFLVRVEITPETRLNPESDEQFPRPPEIPPDWSDFVPGLTPVPGDIVVTKRQWGAFYGTDLDLRLRRGGIDSIVLCGISTEFGVESTARFAYEYGYSQVFAEDAMTSRSPGVHALSCDAIFRRMGRVRKTAEILDALVPGT